jgi:DNA polymerase-3 subunit alpha
MKLTVLPPDVNFSKIKFTVEDKSSVRYGLGAIKGVGEAALAGIIEERQKGKPFTSLFDFCQRVDMKKINRRVMNSLVKSGALDSLGGHRASLAASLTKALQIAEQHRRNNDSGQNDMFGLMTVDEDTHIEEPLDDAPLWSEEQLLIAEKETLGLYLSGHPIDRYIDELSKFIPKRINELDAPEAKGYQRNEIPVITAGLIVAIRTMKGRNGGRMAFITLDDQTARLEVRVFAEVYEQYQAILQPDKLVVMQGKIGQDNFTGGLAATADAVYDIARAREMCGKSLLITIDNKTGMNNLTDSLQSTLLPFREGLVTVELEYINQAARTLIRLGDDWKVSPSDELIAQLSALPAVSAVRMTYNT